MDEKTPGRAAYEATSLPSPDLPQIGYPQWSELPDYVREFWDKAADAACDAAVVHADTRLAAERDEARAERDRLRKQLDDLRTSLDYAAAQWAANAMPHTLPQRSGEYRSVMADCARDLRYALKANAPDAADVRAERDQLREQHAALRARVAAIAQNLEESANATRPSRKTDIQDDTAQRIREALADPDGRS